LGTRKKRERTGATRFRFTTDREGEGNQRGLEGILGVLCKKMKGQGKNLEKKKRGERRKRFLEGGSDKPDVTPA